MVSTSVVWIKNNWKALAVGIGGIIVVLSTGLFVCWGCWIKW